jgi:CheY-like chemotaxis protein
LSLRAALAERTRCADIAASLNAPGSGLRHAYLVSLRCLIVDDNAEFLASASRLLDSQGLQIVGCASSGAEAIVLAETLQPDVVLVDIQLGDEDGFELTRRLTASARSARVVLISTRSEDELAELIADSQAVGFLAKTALSAAAIAALVR